MDGKITISRMGMSSNPDNNTIILEIEDTLSGLNILRLEMSPEEYGMLVSAAGSRDCTITRPPTSYTLENMGKTFEGKTVYLPDFDKYKYRDDELAAETEIVRLLADEIMGEWSINSMGLTSHQNDPRGHRVHLKRYV